MSTFEIVLLLLLFLLVVGVFRIAKWVSIFVDSNLTDIVKEALEEMRNGEN